jgi:hypothetical protein
MLAQLLLSDLGSFKSILSGIMHQTFTIFINYILFGLYARLFFYLLTIMLHIHSLICLIMVLKTCQYLCRGLSFLDHEAEIWHNTSELV